jgi:hypothetical protein
MREHKYKEYKNRGENGRGDLLAMVTDKKAMEIDAEIPK